MSFKMVNVQHRHCVFAIDDEFRRFFAEDRSLLGLLFTAVQKTILRLFHKDNKTEKFTPGFISVLHNFGCDLKWNPHIHCFVSEGVLVIPVNGELKPTSITLFCAMLSVLSS